MFGKTCVQSLIDTDFYKLTMQQAYLHQIPNAESVWEFRCRTDEDLTPYAGKIREQLDALSDLYVTDDQIAYLRNRAPYLKDDYLAFLRLFRFNMTQLEVSINRGVLVIRGRELHLRQLSVEGGQVSVDGSVDALLYEEPRREGGFWARLLG